MKRFIAQKRVTDSGRSRVWFVVDTLKVFPVWMFDTHKEGRKNESEANAAAALLNQGLLLSLADTP